MERKLNIVHRQGRVLGEGWRVSVYIFDTLNCKLENVSIWLKWHYGKKISSFFPSDFERVFAYHLTDKILSFEFYPKAVYFECKFWILRSTITHVQN